MKTKNFLVGSLLLVGSAALAQQSFEQDFFDQQTIENQTLDELRARCQVYEQHDQIFPFKIKLDYSGHYYTDKTETCRVDFEHEGSSEESFSIKCDRFRVRPVEDTMPGLGQMSLSCNRYFQKQIKTNENHPNLTVELNSCDDINKPEVMQIVKQQIAQIKNEQAGTDVVVESGWELIYDTCLSYVNAGATVSCSGSVTQ